MGFDPVTGRTLFVLANGAVVPRRPTSQLASTCIPFNWMPKTFTIASHLPIPSASQSLSQPAPNSVIQLPYTPHTHAIDLIMDRIPDPHQSFYAPPNTTSSHTSQQYNPPAIRSQLSQTPYKYEGPPPTLQFHSTAPSPPFPFPQTLRFHSTSPCPPFPFPQLPLAPSSPPLLL